MILTIFRLCRDRHTEQESFGHMRYVPGVTGVEPRYFPSLGCPIELHSIKLKTNLFKMVEYYDQNKGPVIAERLCWRFGTSLYPYKVRFIQINQSSTMHDVDLLFLPNLSTIHKKLTNNHVTFSSPIQYYLNTTSPPWHNNHNHEHLSYLNNKYQDWMSTFAYAEDCWVNTKSFVDSFDDASSDNQEEAFKNFILPTPPIRDPITANYSARPLNTGGLAFEMPNTIPFDVSPPRELTILHPDKTIYSPKIGYSTLTTLEELALQYSDLSLEYILSNTAIVRRRDNYAISRYRKHPIVDIEANCNWIILNEFLDILFRRTQDIRLVSDIRITFVMTYGEEVLFEAFEYETNECLGALHIDMAMFALSAPGLNAGVESF